MLIAGRLHKALDLVGLTAKLSVSPSRILQGWEVADGSDASSQFPFLDAQIVLVSASPAVGCKPSRLSRSQEQRGGQHHYDKRVLASMGACCLGRTMLQEWRWQVTWQCLRKIEAIQRRGFWENALDVVSSAQAGSTKPDSMMRLGCRALARHPGSSAALMVQADGSCWHNGNFVEVCRSSAARVPAPVLRAF